MTGMPSQPNFLISTVPIAQLSAAPAISRAPTGAAPTTARSLPISITSASHAEQQRQALAQGQPGAEHDDAEQATPTAAWCSR